VLPDNPSGSVYVKVVDTDQTSGNSAKDTVYVDHMYIRTDMEPGYPPSPPTDLFANTASSSQIELSWTDNADNEAGFNVERSPDGIDGWSEVGTVGPDILFYSDTGLDPNTTYYYRVQAFNGSGASDYSSPSSATTNQADNSTVHVSDLDGSSTPGNRNRWSATVTITVMNDALELVSGAEVFGSWSSGVNGSGSCVTTNGSCSITKNNIKGNNSSVTFTVTNIVPGSGTYYPGSNSDLDGDSDGTSITITRPDVLSGPF
jgi:hypothetical protein